MIQHIWFDFSDTLAKPSQQHDQLLLETYAAAAVKKKVTPELQVELAKKYDTYKSNFAIFNALGLPAGYWSSVITAQDPTTLYEIFDENIPHILDQLSKESANLNLF